MTRLVCGVGINDANYVVRPLIDGKKVTMCPFYQVWCNMLKRCCPKYQAKHPTYVGCQVCEEWKTFLTFKAWMEKQDWEEKQLDKDLLSSDVKLYSPETCCFVESWLNKLFTDCGRARGEWSIGVCLHKCGKFQANLRVKGKRVHLGLYVTPEEAHNVYLKAKREHVAKLMENYPNQRIKQAVLEKLDALL